VRSPDERRRDEGGAGAGQPPGATPARAVRRAVPVPVRPYRAHAYGGANSCPADERPPAASPSSSAATSRPAAAPPPDATAAGALEVRGDAEHRQHQRAERPRPRPHGVGFFSLRGSLSSARWIGWKEARKELVEIRWVCGPVVLCLMRVAAQWDGRAGCGIYVIYCNST
jgi:hypothetical protein